MPLSFRRVFSVTKSELFSHLYLAFAVAIHLRLYLPSPLPLSLLFSNHFQSAGLRESDEEGNQAPLFFFSSYFF